MMTTKVLHLGTSTNSASRCLTAYDSQVLPAKYSCSASLATHAVEKFGKEHAARLLSQYSTVQVEKLKVDLLLCAPSLESDSHYVPQLNLR